MTLAAEESRRITAASGRVHTRKPNPMTSKFSGMFNKVLLVCFIGLLAWAYQATQPPAPKMCGTKDGPPVTGSRIQLKDGRYLAYQEFGVPKDIAKHKIVFVHGFDCGRQDVSAVTTFLSPDIVESEGIYIVSYDRPGYGESDPNPIQTVKSRALDVEELADQLELGSRFYVIGFSLGGQIVWSCLKYIPHRLAGATLVSPVINYWWKGIPSNLSDEAYKQQLPEDKWALAVAHYMPWLNYWWSSQKLFPSSSLLARSPKVFSQHDMELLPRFYSIREKYQAQVRQQGEYESVHRDLVIAFGGWEFDPTDLKNPFPNREGSVNLWMGDEDVIIPVKLQRHIVHQLPWINYHEVPGAGHMFAIADGVVDSIIRELIA